MGLAKAIQKATEKVMDVPGIGVEITFRAVTPSAYNTTTGVVSESTSDTTLKAAFEDVSQREVNDLIQADDRKCVIPASSLSAKPKTADRVVYGGVNYQIIRVFTISQAGTDISYELILRS